MKKIVRCLRILVSSIMIVVLSAASSFPEEINLDRLPIAKTKLDFLTLYKTQWELFGLPRKLKQAVDDAFTEQTEDLMWGTVRMQLVMNTDNIQEKIQQAAEYKFAEDYDKFLSELEDNWGEKLVRMRRCTLSLTQTLWLRHICVRIMTVLLRTTGAL